MQQKAQQKSGSGSSLGAGESDQNVRKVLARQHAKDISEYTKQIHAKDRELTEIRKKVAKVHKMILEYLVQRFSGWLRESELEAVVVPIVRQLVACTNCSKSFSLNQLRKSSVSCALSVFKKWVLYREVG